jgi:O-antigen/teichoic acid export membrane protein
MSIWYKLTDKTYYGTFITVAGAAITIGLNYILIPYYGYMGSSWATFICYFAMAVACYFLGRKFYPIPYNILKGILYIVITLAIVSGVNAITLPNQWLATGFHTIVLILFVGGIYLLEKKHLRSG